VWKIFSRFFNQKTKNNKKRMRRKEDEWEERETGACKLNQTAKGLAGS
jgi:hypothetical protein